LGFYLGMISLLDKDKDETSANQDDIFLFEKHYFKEITNIISTNLDSSEAI
jgi:hypothetical protein